MVAPALPRIAEQLTLYRAVLDAAGDKPVTFRTLDIGGDKVLPYMRSVEEENPALGWRAIRLGLDRPGLMRSQVRALLRAAAGRELVALFDQLVDHFSTLLSCSLNSIRQTMGFLPHACSVPA